jgi:hypothetical protein
MVCIATDSYLRDTPRAQDKRSAVWVRKYLWLAALGDFGCASVAALAAVLLRFGNNAGHNYVALSLALPVLRLAALWLAGAYDVRVVGTGSDEFRKVINAGVGLTAAIAIGSYANNMELSRGYLPQRQREVLVLRFHLGLREGQIASTMEITRGTVKVHIRPGHDSHA